MYPPSAQAQSNNHAPSEARPASHILAGRDALDVAAVMDEVPFTVYRLYDEAERLLYVGMTKRSLGERLRGHQYEQPWWPEVVSVTVQSCGTWEEAVESESLGITQEGPRYNKNGRTKQLDLGLVPVRREMTPAEVQEAGRILLGLWRGPVERRHPDYS